MFFSPILSRNLNIIRVVKSLETELWLNVCPGLPCSENIHLWASDVDRVCAHCIPFIEAPPIFCGPEASQNYPLPAETVRSNVDSEQHGHFQEQQRAWLGSADLDIVLTGGSSEANKIIFSAAGEPCVRKMGIFGAECVLWHNLSIPPANRHLPTFLYWAILVIISSPT